MNTYGRWPDVVDGRSKTATILYYNIIYKSFV